MNQPELQWTPYPGYSAPVLFDVRGVRRTGSLFVETSQDTNRTPIFTLKDHDYKDYISAYRIYMESQDEYDAAMHLVGSMSHWRKLLGCKWFLEGDESRGFMGLAQWRKDMMARDASTAKRVLIDKVRDGDRQAAQFLMNYATKGEQAGLAQSTVKKPKAVPARRGAQLQPETVDFAAVRERIQGNDNA